MMDLGSIICKPANPTCNSCPVLKYCLAHKNNTYKSIPFKTKKVKKVAKKGYLYIGITDCKKIILIKRPNTGLLGGTICPPTSEWKINKFPIPSMSTIRTAINKVIDKIFTNIPDIINLL